MSGDDDEYVLVNNIEDLDSGRPTTKVDLAMENITGKILEINLQDGPQEEASDYENEEADEADEESNYNFEDGDIDRLDEPDETLNPAGNLQGQQERKVHGLIVSGINGETFEFSGHSSELLSSLRARLNSAGYCSREGSFAELTENNQERTLTDWMTLVENGLHDGCVLVEKSPFEVRVQVFGFPEERVGLSRIEDLKSVIIHRYPFLEAIPFVILKCGFHDKHTVHLTTATNIQDGDILVFRELEVFLSNYNSNFTTYGYLRWAVYVGPSARCRHHQGNELLDITTAVLNASNGPLPIASGSSTLILRLRRELLLEAAQVVLQVRSTADDPELMENRLPSGLGGPFADMLFFCPVQPLQAGQLLHVAVMNVHRNEELLSFWVRAQ